ncbi:DUF2637 domain-containing protein [Streptomyces sp. JJ38]|uniref:DUF2637 domain-containing protein n=1 Tax=Streptomyces sp. JJ38 TaxID=2738128 RepID=UPI001C562687|nr:DUF2637 domain-containing protein [Streptomyces sp. JJ38]MBW1596138.1 DUF2637 domain-containing protein [Streptomyces sp. JJ38]
MELTDGSLNWAVAGAVMLAGLLGAVILMARGRKPAEDSAQGDSWERTEERRRRKETVYATASYLLLFCCAGVAAALSFHGLVGFGRQNLNLSGGWEYLVPFGLDGAAMFSALIAVREASHGDASLGSRLLVWIFAGAAAWFNWVHAPRGAAHAGAPHFFAGMSISAAILFDRALKQTRKAALRERGLVPRPLPQIRAVRWLRAPRETYKAWSLMLLEGVRTLDEAVDEVREDRRVKERERARRREQNKLERARLKAISRRPRGWVPGQGGVPGDVEVAVEVEPPVRARPALQPVTEAGTAPGTAGVRAEPGARTEDNRPESLGPDSADIGQAKPRLDSLEEKLAAIERQFG